MGICSSWDLRQLLIVSVYHGKLWFTEEVLWHWQEVDGNIIIPAQLFIFSNLCPDACPVWQICTLSPRANLPWEKMVTRLMPPFHRESFIFSCSLPYYSNTLCAISPNRPSSAPTTVFPPRSPESHHSSAHQPKLLGSHGYQAAGV